MSKKWYNEIAKKNGGYKSDVNYILEGPSGEVYFEEWLKSLVGQADHVLDIGCGHGAFTLEIAKFAKRITGADNAGELLKIAKDLLKQEAYDHVDFTFAWTKGNMPFEKNTFDLIYSRRGPTSILNHLTCLKPGGIIVGIHTFDLDIETYIKKMQVLGLEEISYKTFDQARYFYDQEEDMKKHLSSMHMSLDYTLKENQEAFDRVKEKHSFEGRLSYPQNRYVWFARKPFKD